MARIRSIKPEFFKHGDLQDLEIANPGQYVMLVYAGLWTLCDKNGVFLCNARDIKNEILPYINFDMQKTLDVLEKDGYFVKYQFKGKVYGFVPTFEKYQFPTANEKKCPPKYPAPPENFMGKEHFETFSSTSENVPENELERSQAHSQAGRIKDKGIQDKRIKDLSGSSKPPEEKNGSFTLLDKEPKNDKERVEKQWLLNYREMYGTLPVNPAWSLSAPLIKQNIKQIGVDKVLHALEAAKNDELCLKSGYILKMIMASNIISRLVNQSRAPPRHKISADNVSPENINSYFKEAGHG
jgi:hypothetical protein